MGLTGFIGCFRVDIRAYIYIYRGLKKHIGYIGFIGVIDRAFKYR